MKHDVNVGQRYRDTDPRETKREGVVESVEGGKARVRWNTRKVSSVRVDRLQSSAYLLLSAEERQINVTSAAPQLGIAWDETD